MIGNIQEKIPKIIWILWYQGWEQAPAIAKKCLETWEFYNPDWKIIKLSSANVYDYINIEQNIENCKGKDISNTAYSDLIRIHLLKKYGGVWVDSTLLCVRPLNHWVYDVSEQGFFAFSKPGPDRMISSWFLVARKGNYIIEHWLNNCITYWNQCNKAHHYFWFHYLFGDIYLQNELFRKEWDSIPKLTADKPHYFTPYGQKFCQQISPVDKDMLHNSDNPVFKLTYKYKPEIVTEDSVIQYLLHYKLDNTSLGETTIT